MSNINKLIVRRVLVFSVLVLFYYYWIFKNFFFNYFSIEEKLSNVITKYFLSKGIVKWLFFIVRFLWFIISIIFFCILFVWLLIISGRMCVAVCARDKISVNGDVNYIDNYNWDAFHTNLGMCDIASIETLTSIDSAWSHHSDQENFAIRVKPWLECNRFEPVCSPNGSVKRWHPEFFYHSIPRFNFKKEKHSERPGFFRRLFSCFVRRKRSNDD